ncbi:MAG: GNAT family N-acetyltransferase [Micromonosporaceae bacterium]|nr:GNAT family N-acetyltransferase [Micromonosporaceae bacterium]
MTGLSIRRVRFASPEAQRLVAEALAELAVRYDAESGDDTPIGPEDFEPPRGAFLLAYVEGRTVGCGGWRSHGEDAEIKRMYVVPAARGNGVGRAVLRALEESAREYGRVRMILETGLGNPEAIALYQRHGYRRIPDYGYYRGYPDVRSFARDL